MRYPSSLLVALLMLIPIAGRADLQNDLTTLHRQYEAQVVKAGQRGPYSTSAFRLAFSTGGPAPEMVGNVLRAIDLQEGELKKLADEPGVSQIVRPGNDFKTNFGLLFTAASIGGGCRHCRSMAERLAYARGSRAMMAVYDIQAAGLRSSRSKVKFSGLPFFDYVTRVFLAPTFQERTIRFYSELEKVVGKLVDDPTVNVDTNVLKIAMNVCDGDSHAAIELAGLLLARDSNVIKYFSFMPKTGKEFTRSAALTPLLVQLIVRLDETRSGRTTDQFSFDGTYSVSDPRGYYFWSAALVSDQLRREGVSEEDIMFLNLQFARHYKILRWYEAQAGRVGGLVRGDGLAPFDQAAHEFQARRTMRITSGGVRMSRRLSEEQSCKELTEKI